MISTHPLQPTAHWVQVPLSPPFAGFPPVVTGPAKSVRLLFADLAPMRTNVMTTSHSELKSENLLGKRLMDLGVILALSPFVAPIAAALVLYLGILSKGSPFYRQVRIGRGGRAFHLFKFRTMRVNAGTRVHSGHLSYLLNNNVPMEKLDSRDSRLLPGTRWIRKLGLDELPQLWNVVRGDMSLVGPRPCLPYEYKMFGKMEKQRFQTLPGISGLWQVSGKNKLTFSEMNQLDLYYTNHRNPGMDLSIMLKTPFVMISPLFEGLSWGGFMRSGPRSINSGKTI